MKLEEMSPELWEKAKACKTSDEFLALAQHEGIELIDEQLEEVAGCAVSDFFHNFIHQGLSVEPNLETVKPNSQPPFPTIS